VAVADKLRKIVSGGQTGVDRAALDWALARGVPCGGWCPLGRWAEDGPIDAWYPLRETPDADPAQRTEWNVRDSDGTLIVTLARRMAKPLLHLAKADSPAAGQAESLSQFIGQHEIRVLNVAGPRESGEPGVGEFAAVLLEAALGQPDEA
tara:strand:- start:1553 stop:2002 length:450 start_codon:yes stop_codon:yes gene_type:complete